MSNNELAIVIPAYKARYLDSALASIAAQTDRHFSVFVGDDASPDDLAAICNSWRDRLPIRYHRFEQNLGRDNLVAQWSRCIRETREPWVWLFGDDDEMGPDCVEAWRAFQAGRPEVDLFHFEADRIDENGRNMGRAPPWPARMSSRQFALARLRFDIDSYAPDYIFRRSAWERVGGFQPFPLAWCSDDATWIKIAALNGVHTVPGSRVRWRMSGINISSAATVRSGDKTRACLQTQTHRCKA